MTERAYTINEIDALRRVVADKYLWGRYSGFKPPVVIHHPDGSWSQTSTGHSRSYDPRELDNHVEQRVRTIMQAGLVARDLLDSER